MMAGVRRVVFSIVCGVSLLLLLAMVGVWVRSYWVRDIVSYVSNDGHARLIQSIRGRLHIVCDLDGQSSGSFSHQEDRLATGCDLERGDVGVSGECGVACGACVAEVLALPHEFLWFQCKTRLYHQPPADRYSLLVASDAFCDFAGGVDLAVREIRASEEGGALSEV